MDLLNITNATQTHKMHMQLKIHSLYIINFYIQSFSFTRYCKFLFGESQLNRILNDFESTICKFLLHIILTCNKEKTIPCSAE